MRLNTSKMKTTYLITYDLKKPGRDYTSLYKAIKALGSWCHPVESTWFVNTTQEVIAIRDSLAAVMDTNDKLIVLKSSLPGATQNLLQSDFDWLNSNLS